MTHLEVTKSTCMWMGERDRLRVSKVVQVPDNSVREGGRMRGTAALWKVGSWR